MRALRQVGIVGLLGLRTLHTRLWGTLIVVVGLTCVSVALLAPLSLEEGMKLSYLHSGHADRAVVLSSRPLREITNAIVSPRNLHEINSSIEPSWVRIIERAPGIRRARNGAPLVDAESYLLLQQFRKNSNGRLGATGIRGVGVRGLEMSPELKLVDGRWYRPGTREIDVGVTARRKFSGLGLGDRVVMLNGQPWTVVGHFQTHSFIDGDIIADPQMMMNALRRSNYNFVLVGLASFPHAFHQLKTALERNPALSVIVERQSTYWAREFRDLPPTAIVMGYLIGLLVASGAVAGILHTMHATVGSRAKEIAILRAVGFGGFPIAVSIVFESMAFAIIGAAIGTVIDWLWVNGYPYNGAYGVFRAAVTPHLLLVAIGWALTAALVGAIGPAAKEARLPVADALSRL